MSAGVGIEGSEITLSMLYCATHMYVPQACHVHSSHCSQMKHWTQGWGRFPFHTQHREATEYISTKQTTSTSSYPTPVSQLLNQEMYSHVQSCIYLISCPRSIDQSLPHDGVPVLNAGTTGKNAQSTTMHDPFMVELYTFVQLCEVEIKLKLRINYTHSKDMSAT